MKYVRWQRRDIAFTQVKRIHSYNSIKRVFFRAAFVGLLGGFGLMPLKAANWHVPGGVPTIQQAINQASHGDRVIVAPGTYKEYIRFNGKAITVVGDPCDPGSVILDGTAATPPAVATVVTFWNNEEPNSVLEGFTIQGGKGTLLGTVNRFGGGIVCIAAKPTIRRCWIVNNEGTQFGGAIQCESDAWPRLEYCEIRANKTSSGKRGGGIYCANASVTLKHCLFKNNSSGYGGALMLYGSSSGYMFDCVFEANAAGLEGGAIYSKNGYLTATRCRFNANSATNYGGGLYLWLTQAKFSHCMVNGNTAKYGAGMQWDNCSQSWLRHSVIAGNRAAEKGGGFRLLNSSNIEIRNSIIWHNLPLSFDSPTSVPVVAYALVEGGYTGTGNIDADPCFAAAGSWNTQSTATTADDVWQDVDYTAGDSGGLTAYRPQAALSRCVDSGDPNLMPESADETDWQGGRRYCGFSGDLGVYELYQNRRVYYEQTGQWYDAISAAIAAAADDAVFWLAPGRHPGNVYLPRPMTLRSLNPTAGAVIEATVLDGSDAADPTVTVMARDDERVRLWGLTISGGSGLLEQDGSRMGGGVFCGAGKVLVQHCLLRDNQAHRGAALAALAGAGAVLSNSVIVHNTVLAEQGGALYWEGADGSVASCTVRGNDGAAIVAANAATVTAVNSLLWGNDCDDNETCGAQTLALAGTNMNLSYCNVQGGWPGAGTGNINKDPLFQTYEDDMGTPFDPCDDITRQYDYILKSNSPCVNYGDSDYEADPCLLMYRMEKDEDLGYVTYYTDPCSGARRFTDLDFSGRMRRQFCCIDIGAYEVPNAAPAGLPHVVSTLLDWYCTVQEAVDNSYEKGTVVLGRGVYRENVVITQKELRLRSTNPFSEEVVDATVIDGGDRPREFDTADPNYFRDTYYYSAVTIPAGEGPHTKIEGLTLRGGSGCGDTAGTAEPGDDWWKGGGLFCRGNNGIIIQRCHIYSNHSQLGGGLYFYDSDNLTIAFNKLVDNSGIANGGAIRLDTCETVTINNNIISKNWTDHYAGALYAAACKALTFHFNTVVNNVYGIHFYDCCDVEVENSIFWDNLYQQIEVNDSQKVMVQYCDVMGGYEGPGNVDADPCFVRNAGTTDPNSEIWNEGDYRLQTTALYRTKLLNETDLNDDGIVNVADYALLAAEWQFEGGNAVTLTADFDASGVVDINDLLILAANYLRQDPNAMWRPFSNYTSICIDAGNPDHFPDEEDADESLWKGENNWVNMGCYGGTNQASPAPPSWSAQADLTNNGKVDLADWVLYVNGSPLWSDNLWDFNGDNTKDLEDLAAFSSYWLWQSERAALP